MGQLPQHHQTPVRTANYLESEALGVGSAVRASASVAGDLDAGSNVRSIALL